jgi:ribosomal protein S27AE
MILGLPVSAIGMGLGVFDMPIGLAIILIPMFCGFALASRLECPKCHFRLSKKFPVGALVLLYFASEKCPRCGEEL